MSVYLQLALVNGTLSMNNSFKMNMTNSEFVDYMLRVKIYFKTLINIEFNSTKINEYDNREMPPLKTMIITSRGNESELVEIPLEVYRVSPKCTVLMAKTISSSFLCL